jgi:predicted nucleic acid-binding protein
LLNEAKHKLLVLLGNHSLEDVKVIAERHFEQWFKSAVNLYKHFTLAPNDSDVKDAAFLVH